MTARSRRNIEHKTKELLEGLGIEGPPVDIESVAKSLGYRVVFKFYDDQDLSGTVFVDGSGVTTLGINTIHPRVRQRFSIAHEIGHAQLHLTAQHGKDELFVDPPTPRTLFRDDKASLGEDKEEIEANQFAAGILMPDTFIKKVGSALIRQNQSISVLNLIDALANRFEVSTQAMNFRLITLGIIEPDQG